MTWSISIVELVQLIESKAFSILQFLSNSIQEIIDSNQDLGPESRARLEVFIVFLFIFFQMFLFFNICLFIFLKELCFDPIRVPNTAFGISLRYAGTYEFELFLSNFLV